MGFVRCEKHVNMMYLVLRYKNAVREMFVRKEATAVYIQISGVPRECVYEFSHAFRYIYIYMIVMNVPGT